MRSSPPSTSTPRHENGRPDTAEAGRHPRIGELLSAVPLIARAEEVAQACVDALRPVLGPCRLVLPPAPLPVAVGAPPDGLTLLLRFPAVGGNGELWCANAGVAAETRRAIEAQLARLWSVQAERAAQAQEMNRLRFQLAALQQVAHTLAVVRDVAETEKLVVDSVKEVFFAWWAALYAAETAAEYVLRTAATPRREDFPTRVPVEAVRTLLGGARGSPRTLTEPEARRGRLPPDATIVVDLDLGDAGAGLLALGPRMTGAAYDAHDAALLRALAETSAIALRNAGLLDRLRIEAVRDALTGCHNRRGFNERLTLEFHRCQRYGRELALVVLDIDHFKKINDDFGHEVGDHALRRVGEVLTVRFRCTDAACRLGGEEFALIFPETPKHEAVRLAERVRAAIETLGPDAIVPRRLTASVGVAAYPDDAVDIEGLIRAADRALYRAKANGRNRVESAGDGPA